MGSTIRARFSHGTLKPLEAVELREGDEVTITIVSSRAESGGDWLERTAGGWADVSQRLKDLQPQGLGLSVVSAAELREGAYFSRNPKRSQETLEGFLSNPTST